MKSQSPTRLLAFVLSMFVATVAAQAPLGSAFTYQGRLEQSGTPANGPIPMVFRLWDAPAGGNQVGPTLAFDGVGGNPPPVAVDDGAFTVALDFGVFDSNARWLEITVYGETLAPRQAITPAPAALFSFAPWATDGGTVSYTGGNVGIGTTQPSTVLEVSRTTGDTEIGIVGGDGGRRWTLQSSNGLEPDLGGSFQIIDRTANEARLVINDMGHVGIGTPYPDRALVVVGDTGLFGDVRLGTGFPPSNTIVDGNTLLNGNVGINTYPFAPQDRLHVVGNVLVNNGTVRLESGHLQVDLGDVLIETGRIRFGVSNDNSDPISIARANISSDYSALVINIGDNPGAGVPPGDDLIIQAGGSNQFIFRSNGQAAKTGVPFWDTISDRRAKHDIEPLTGVLDRLMQLEGRVFSYNEPNQPGAREGRCIGFIAQEVEPIFPDWVSTDREGMKIMHTAGFEALAVEAMRELRAEKDAELKAIRGENESLRQENEALRDRLDAVENLLDTLVREAALEKSH